jgi:hypothetical protein
MRNAKRSSVLGGRYDGRNDLLRRRLCQNRRYFKGQFSRATSEFFWSGNNIVVFVSGDQNVGKVYLYDIAKKSLEPIYSLKPELEGKNSLRSKSSITPHVMV